MHFFLLFVGCIVAAIVMYVKIPDILDIITTHDEYYREQLRQRSYYSSFSLSRFAQLLLECISYACVFFACLFLLWGLYYIKKFLAICGVLIAIAGLVCYTLTSEGSFYQIIADIMFFRLSIALYTFWVLRTVYKLSRGLKKWQVRNANITAQNQQYNQLQEF